MCTSLLHVPNHVVEAGKMLPHYAYTSTSESSIVDRGYGFVLCFIILSEILSSKARSKLNIVYDETERNTSMKLNSCPS